MSRVVVLGAGLAGLAAACHLIADGHQVSVLERESVPGGRCGALRQDGFAFSSGATVLTMPELVAEPLARIGTPLADVLDLTRLDPGYRAHFHDSSSLDVPASTGAFREEIASAVGSDAAAAFDRFVAWLGELYDIELPNFIDRNFDSVAGLAWPPSAAAKLLRMGAFDSLDAVVRRFFGDERLVRLFTFQALYAGLSPLKARALYAVIAYMDTIRGVYHPRGGMVAVPQAMADALRAAGADLHYDTTARAVLRRGGRVAGVETGDGERIGADAVVCTLDPPVAYRELLRDLTLPRPLREPRYSPSALVWHVGVRGVPRGVAHHNIYFGQDWTGAFDDLIERRTMMTDPSRLVSVPSLTDPDAAPPGHSALYVLEPVPDLGSGIDYAREAPPARERLLEFLAEQGYPTDIVTERLVTPLDWQAQGLAAGTPFALAHTFAQTGPFRPANVERRAPGLFFAGSGTVPGVGIPMVLISGKLAARRVSRYLPAEVRG